MGFSSVSWLCLEVNKPHTKPKRKKKFTTLIFEIFKVTFVYSCAKYLVPEVQNLNRMLINFTQVYKVEKSWNRFLSRMFLLSFFFVSNKNCSFYSLSWKWIGHTLSLSIISLKGAFRQKLSTVTKLKLIRFRNCTYPTLQSKLKI